MRASIRKDDNALSFELRNVSTGTGDWVTAIYIGGVLRTEVDLSKLFYTCTQSYCGTLDLNTVYYICQRSYYSDWSYLNARIYVGTSCTMLPNNK